jgi:hypothetical protein
MEQGTETSDSSYEASGNSPRPSRKPLEWRSWSKLPDLLLGCLRWRIIMEGSAPSDSTVSVRWTRNVVALATQDSLDPPLGKKKKLDGGAALGLTGTISGSRSGWATLRREQWQQLESGCHSKDQATGKWHHQQKPRNRNSDTLIRYSGWTALRKEQCDGLLKPAGTVHCWATFIKHILELTQATTGELPFIYVTIEELLGYSVLNVFSVCGLCHPPSDAKMSCVGWYMRWIWRALVQMIGFIRTLATSSLNHI